MGFSGALGGLGKTPPEEKQIVPSSRARPDSQGTQPGGQKKVSLRSSRARPDSHGTQSGGIIESSCSVGSESCNQFECLAVPNSLASADLETKTDFGAVESMFKFGLDSPKEIVQL